MRFVPINSYNVYQTVKPQVIFVTKAVLIVVGFEPICLSEM